MSQYEILKQINTLRQLMNEIKDHHLRRKFEDEINSLENKVTNNGNKELVPQERVLNVLKYGERTGLAIVLDDDGKKRLCIVEIIGNNIYIKERVVLRGKVSVGELMKIGRKIYVSPNKIPPELVPTLEAIKAEEIDIL